MNEMNRVNKVNKKMRQKKKRNTHEKKKGKTQTVSSWTKNQHATNVCVHLIWHFCYWNAGDDKNDTVEFTYFEL